MEVQFPLGALKMNERIKWLLDIKTDPQTRWLLLTYEKATSEIELISQVAGGIVTSGAVVTIFRASLEAQKINLSDLGPALNLGAMGILITSILTGIRGGDLAAKAFITEPMRDEVIDAITKGELK